MIQQVFAHSVGSPDHHLGHILSRETGERAGVNILYRCLSGTYKPSGVTYERSSTHHVAVVRFGHEEHPAHQVGGGDALRALTLPVAAFALHLLLVGVTVVNHVVTVEAERREDDVISTGIENKLEVLEQKHDRGQNR
ncbi:hypothetical protein EYF80_022960 [Liparis tanakae]|uniref:Uncharacterized protein n=1 Tax=Liparis tanakae TaxID=230148 RepID=A0A4Z2HMX4_9TELE|nr:hypothetical protein EYF80_022960 [Liparis tanakae]